MPHRIRLSRAAGWRKPEGAVVVARPTKWGNPHLSHDQVTRAVAVQQYRETLQQRPDLLRMARAELRGRDLACWCPLDQPCHADVLLEYANDPATADPAGDQR